MSTSGKGKASISTNGVETYSKEALSNEIRRLIIINVQLMTDKMEIEKVRVNLEVDKVRLFDEKNFLVVKRKELRAEIVVLNVVRSFNAPTYGYQNSLLKSTRDKFKAKRPSLFDSLKENF